MILDNTEEYDYVWDKIYADLGFKPSCEYRGHSLNVTLPFSINAPHIIYAIENMSNSSLDNMEEIIRTCLINGSTNDEWYALDWNHSAFKFDPRNKEEMTSVKIIDNQYLGGEYNAYFPDFYPDGDYYFFIDTRFENGYLGHPWRQEVWIFGQTLIDEIKKVSELLNWRLIKDI